MKNKDGRFVLCLENVRRLLAALGIAFSVLMSAPHSHENAYLANSYCQAQSDLLSVLNLQEKAVEMGFEDSRVVVLENSFRIGLKCWREQKKHGRTETLAKQCVEDSLEIRRLKARDKMSRNQLKWHDWGVIRKIMKEKSCGTREAANFAYKHDSLWFYGNASSAAAAYRHALGDYTQKRFDEITLS